MKTTMAVLAVLGVVAAACGGGGDDGPAYEPAKADAIAHAALLSPVDLPGSGWVIASRDQFPDSERLDAAVDSAACTSAEAKSKAAKDAAAADRAGRARLELTLAAKGSVQISTTIDHTVSIQNTEEATDRAMEAFRALAASDDMGKCLGEVVSKGLGSAPGSKVTATTVKAAGSVPNGGAASAFDIAITIQNQTLEMRVESYVWQDGNAGVTVAITGQKDQVTADVVKKALDTANAKLKAQQGE